MRQLWIVAALVSGGLFLPAQPAVASCAEGSGPAGSAVIFVGTAESERRGYTRFAVDEVRVGPDLAPEVWVQSGQEQPPWPMSLVLAVGSSGDADFIDGQQYVVGASPSFATGACSVSEADVGTRSPGAREPVVDGASGADPPIGPLGQTLWIAGGLAVIAGTVSFVRRRRRLRRLGVAPSS